jgi:hypothetical protein
LSKLVDKIELLHRSGLGPGQTFSVEFERSEKKLLASNDVYSTNIPAS